jgi:5-formyltetrahydrofolate cyclo-ligase
MVMEKGELRDRFKKLRGLKRSYEMDEKIEGKLFSTEEYEAAELILCYVSFRSEVSTQGIIEKSIEKGKRIGIPRTLRTRLEFYEIDSLKNLKKGYMGILEPGGNIKLEISEADLIIVPGLVFDMEGHRIGYGGGYYDRVLKEYNKSPAGKSIGLAYDFQVIEKIPRKEHDMPVDKIITDQRIITLNHRPYKT